MKKINTDISKANTLLGNFYSSKKHFHDSLENIFAHSWQIIIDDSAVKKPNQVYPFYFLNNLLNTPLFLINSNNTIKCFSNVCTHRGNILITNRCKINNNITCKYHGKQFNNCGKFNFMPKTDGMKNFPSKEDDLPEISLKIWRQFIFISLLPRIDFNELIKDIEERVGWMPIEKFEYKEDLSKEYYINANWALYCDNYLEGFHIPFVHNDLNTVLDFENYEIEIFKYCNLQIGIAENKEICFNLPKKSKDYGKNVAAYYFWLFPNIMLNFYPWGLSINIVKPISEKETKIEFKSYVWDKSKLSKGAGANLNKVEMEDEEIVEQVQKGVSSRFYKHGRFSPSMEKGVHHFHCLISDFMNF